MISVFFDLYSHNWNSVKYNNHGYNNYIIFILTTLILWYSNLGTGCTPKRCSRSSVLKYFSWHCHWYNNIPWYRTNEPSPPHRPTNKNCKLACKTTLSGILHKTYTLTIHPIIQIMSLNRILNGPTRR